MRKSIFLYTILFLSFGCDFFYPTRRLDAEPTKHYLSEQYYLNLDKKSFHKVLSKLSSSVYLEFIDSVSYTKNVVYFYSSSRYYRFNFEKNSMDSIKRKGIPRLKGIDSFKDNSRSSFKLN